MSQRFFSETAIAGDRAVLAGSEAHHLIHVLRAAPGDCVVLLDGSGAEFEASVARIGRREVELEILARHEIDREARVPLALAVPLPKGDRARWLVEKAVELGVARIIPLITARSTSGKERGAEKLDRFVIEASKQCGRNRLLEIAAPLKFEELLQVAPSDALRLIAHPAAGGRESFSPSSSDAASRYVEATKTRDPFGEKDSRPLYAAIGPEGGFTGDEVQSALAAGWQPVSLGPRILRVETAALTLAARLVG